MTFSEASGTKREAGAETPRPPCRAAGVLVSLGALLILAQFFSGRSLWLDEARLANNVLGKSYAELLGPLDEQQSAPPLFLWGMKLGSALGGGSEGSLRLLPLLGSLLSLVLFARLALDALPGGAALLALALFTICDIPIYYASMAKPYATDVTAALLLLVLTQRAASGMSRGRLVALAISGILAPWLSLTAPFLLAGTAAVEWVRVLRRGERRGLAAWSILGAAWGLSAALALAHASRLAAGNAGIMEYWKDSYLLDQGGGIRNPAWYGVRFLGVFNDPLAFRFPELAALAFALGAWALGRDRRRTLALLLSPVGFLLIASALRKYPLTDGRLLMFAVPAGLFCVAAGVRALRLAVPSPRAARAAGVLLGAFLLAPSAARAARCVLHPRVKEELRPVLAFVKDRLAPGDALYVYYGADAAFRYYAPRLGLPQDDAIRGSGCRDAPRRYEADLAPLRGRARAWVLFSHVYRREGTDEQELLCSLLEGAGGRILASSEAPGAAAFLYDLSGSGEGR